VDPKGEGLGDTGSILKSRGTGLRLGNMTFVRLRGVHRSKEEKEVKRAEFDLHRLEGKNFERGIFFGA